MSSAAGPRMEDVKVGSLVWVRRKNGKWWPAKVIKSSEIASHQFYSRRTPVRLLGRHNGSVECYNIKNSSRVKLFRCGEFDHLIREAEAYQVSTTIKDSKFASQELAILHALQLEKQGTGLKRPARQLNQSSVCRAKRSKCVHLPVESCNPGEALLHASLLSKISPSAIGTCDSRLGSQMIDEDISGKNVSHSFLKGSEDSVEGGAPHPQVSQKQKLNGEENSREDPISVSKGRSSVECQNTTDSMENVLPGDASYEDKHGFRYGCFEDSDLHCFKSMSNDYQNGKLIEVDVRVEVSYRKEHVPLVCLTSGLNQKAIIGHPVDVEALKEDIRETYAVRDKKSSEKFNTSVKRIDQLVWRRSKRSPVCYITKCSSSATEQDKTKSAYRISRDHPLSTNCRIKTDTLKAQESGSGRRPSCVPVSCVFKNLLSAIGGKQL